jgi:hypothetical protein
MMLDRAREADRSVLLGELTELGRQRREALARAQCLADGIARVLPDALSAGVRLTEIARVTGVSRPTLYAWRGCCGVRARGERAVA